MTVYASPWSPARMDEDQRQHAPGGSLKPEFANAWAEYFVRFIQEYEKQGRPHLRHHRAERAGGSPAAGNPASAASRNGTSSKDHLGPARPGWTPRPRQSQRDFRKIMVWDHNRDIMYDRTRGP